MNATFKLNDGFSFKPCLKTGLALALGWSAMSSSAYWPTVNAYATSPTTISVGQSVSFSVDVSGTMDNWSNEIPGDSGPPLPYWGQYIQRMPGGEGMSESWNWDSLVATVSPDAGLSPMSPQSGNAGPLGTWSFSYQFSQPGSYSVAIDGSWATQVSQWHVQDVVVLECAEYYCYQSGGWTEGGGTSWQSTGNYPGFSLGVNVVPEPGTYALLVAGLVIVVPLVTKRRAAGRAK